MIYIINATSPARKSNPRARTVSGLPCHGRDRCPRAPADCAGPGDPLDTHPESRKAPAPPRHSPRLLALVADSAGRDVRPREGVARAGYGPGPGPDRGSPVARGSRWGRVRSLRSGRGGAATLVEVREGRNAGKERGGPGGVAPTGLSRVRRGEATSKGRWVGQKQVLLERCRSRSTEDRSFPKFEVRVSFEFPQQFHRMRIYFRSLFRTQIFAQQLVMK